MSLTKQSVQHKYEEFLHFFDFVLHTFVEESTVFQLFIENHFFAFFKSLQESAHQG